MRERFSCRQCEAITQPPGPFHVTPRGFAGPNLLAMVLFEDHVLSAERLHGDDTTVPILAKGKTDTGRAWVYVSDDGRVCLTNNAGERALRGLALGRKSWLFAGSQRGADRTAVMYTLIATARLNDIDPHAWLADVLARVADTPQNCLAGLLPWNWRRPTPTVKAA